MVAPMDFNELQRAFFDGLYTYRIPVAIVSAGGVVVLLIVARRLGWFDAARRHPMRAGILAVGTLAVALPLTWYVASPLFIRTELVEPDPVGVLATSAPSATAQPATATAAPSAPNGSPTPAPTPVDPTAFAPSIVAAGSFHGTDDFHFGRGTATIIESAPGTYLLRFEDFSVRNGPDLFVYLSPDPADYTDDALELGRLKATDGAFNYELPPGTEPADFASAIVWCKQFSHLFAVAPFEAG
jgi:hypothetical protein